MRIFVGILLAILVGYSGGCGSGSGGGIDGSGLVIGPIDGFGSIFVNGIEFDTDSATVFLDGLPGQTDQLRLGMIVRVEGRVDDATLTGVASRVSFDDEVEGIVQSLDLTNSSFVVLGQTVVAGARTVFEGTSLAQLTIGDLVEISGQRDAAGVIRATRVELQDEDEGFELTGTITLIDQLAQTFFLSGQLVDFSSAEIENSPSSGLINGLLIEVESDQPLSAGTLIADEIEVLDGDRDGSRGTEVEVEGFVTEILDVETFVLSGSRIVRFSDSTRFEDGTAADLAADVLVEVKGIINGDGILEADEIEFED